MVVLDEMLTFIILFLFVFVLVGLVIGLLSVRYLVEKKKVDHVKR